MRARSPRFALVLAVAAAMSVSACASGGGSTRPAGSSSTRIVRAELEPLGAQYTALQAIERLRPRWLQTRSGSPPVLYVDGARRGSASDLMSMRLVDVEQMEYMSASDATTRFGTGHAGGAIMIMSRR